MNMAGGMYSSDVGNMKQAILVMLDGMAPSPCHEFNRIQKKQDVVTTTILRDVLFLISRYETGYLPLVVSVGSLEALDPTFFKTFQRLDCEWIAPPKIAANLAGDSNVMVALNGRTGTFDMASNADSQYGLLHVSPRNVSTFAHTLNKNLGTSYSVTLRAKDLDQFKERDFLDYEQQLAVLAEFILQGSDNSGGRCFCPNLSSGEVLGCGAGTSLLTVAPDGFIYPCPAFYHAGKSHALASVHELLDAPEWGKKIKQLCRGLNCSVCAFLSRTNTGKVNQATRLAEAETYVRRQLSHHTVHSHRLWRGMCALETAFSRNKSRIECDHLETTLAYPQDVTNDLLCQALIDIHTLALQVSHAEGVPYTTDEIRQRWQPLDGVPSKSRLTLFRTRVQEIVEELLQFRVQRKNSAVCGGDSLIRYEHDTVPISSNSGLSLWLSFEEIEDIHRRYTVYLGWRVLVASAHNDKTNTFYCDDTSWMTTELNLSRIPIDEWFQQTRQRHSFHENDGKHFEVDFERQSLIISNICPLQQRCLTAASVSSPVQEKESENVHLSDMELEFINSLLEMRNAFIDVFRSNYRDAETVNNNRKQVCALLQELGDVTMGINAWYGEKACENGWDPIAAWTIDIQEKMLFKLRNRTSYALESN